MVKGAEWLVNHLLRKAGALRRAAHATAMIDYREKLLKAARELEARAAHLENDMADGSSG